ncbi:MAG TPA: bifunctional phosphopantothenoylcysteine decarboxylase/phosphopantothenate--cysteine ligase CoaBC [Actinomycetota bacterium]|nr:bifunctional phosphopantothenoylcysteine decarboxylase/phosphopantothenate--cysteine ligase CoaBC [Actinomycetota bacterium]
MTIELGLNAGALRGARILLGVSGGISCYKAVEIARLLTKRGAQVQVVMTEAATKFVGPITFSSLTRRPAYTGLFDEADRVLHVRLAREADLVLVAPATANLIAKMAHGLADDLLSAVLLTATAPIVVAPAMHTEMWEHDATRDNVRTLRDRGVVIVDPEEGELAGGDEGVGRLAEPSSIVEAVAATFAHGHDLAGVRVLVTAGGTQEPIDPVRFIGNRSSGKMGFAVASEAARRGAAVTLVTGPTWLEDPDRVDVVRIRTAAEMRDEVLARFPEADVVVKAAAVADFRPANAAGSKIKKDEGLPTITLERTDDILAELGRAKTHQMLVGFSAETDDAVAQGRKKLSAKNLDFIVVNVVGQGKGFEVDHNAAVLLGADGTEDELPLQTKRSLASAILDRVATSLSSRNA